MTIELPPLRDVIERYDLGAKKSLGQHFLLDLNITRKIARAGDTTSDDTILEIGPGPGGLTRALLETGANVIAVERDARCVAALGDLSAAYPEKLQLFEDDALSLDYSRLDLAGPIKIIANLPYNISTELLMRWLKQGSDLWSVMVLMFQKEVSDRILALAGSKTYGRLSVISQSASTPVRAFDLPARAFTPPPKIDSSVVRFDAPIAPLENIAALERVTQAAFSQRRKMLRSSLKSVFGDNLAEILAAVGVKETQRAEEISVEQFITLAKAL
ncbi:MAG: 16S rRNA (adenine(1518)-N(6)/adenine(1519)-N(6))-dimethyltransferase RsmA [Marinicaulis sp.]|nr:16S rRNA (adenine(1518)-N(6)/adenine(1519)-N(6))-dimethyltransferase RsmA [Marinicaulis sp.]